MVMANRRDILAGGGAGLAFALLGNRGPEPDIVIVNGRIWTVDPANPEVQAIAISQGRILAVGSNARISEMAGPATRRIDAGGHRITPGFVDAHAHPAEVGLQYVRMVACDQPTLAAIKAALAARVARTPPGEWVQGFLYDDAKAERPLTIADLDEIAPRNPVLVRHRGGHTAFVNSRALALAGIDRTTVPSANGFIEKDAAGNLTGKIGEDVVKSISSSIKDVPGPNDVRDGIAVVAKMAISRGVTSVCDALGRPEALRAYRAFVASEARSVRITCSMFHAHLDPFIEAGLATGFGDEWLRLGPCKFVTDGSISERTAWLSSPYVGSTYAGTPIGTPEENYAIARKAHAAGWQLSAHANGDLAIRETLSIFERLAREAPRRDPRFRIEHCTVVDADIVRRIKAVGAIPVLFAAYVYFHGEVMRHYGDKRLEHMFAMRDFLDAEVPAASSSDFSASPMDPPMWLQSQVTRTDPTGRLWGGNQKISVAEAIRCGTMNSAQAIFEERERGSLTPGKLADLVIWDRDFFSVEPKSLVSVKPQRVMIGGNWVLEA